MKVLVINCGSSSLKYQLFDMDTESVLAKGLVERIGIDGSQIKHTKTGMEAVVRYFWACGRRRPPSHTVPSRSKSKLSYVVRSDSVMVNLTLLAVLVHLRILPRPARRRG